MSSSISSLGLKALAIVLAIGVWLGISSERREEVLERSFEIPVEAIGIPSELVITDQLQSRVNVRLRGPASQIRSLQEQNLAVTLDLTGARAGTVNIPIPPASLDLPDVVEVMSIQPARVRLRLDERRQRLVPIRPYLVGAPASGFSLENLEVRPSNALITGPASLVQDVTEVPTERIILAGRSATFRATVGVISDYPLIRISEPSRVTVTVTILPVGAGTPQTENRPTPPIETEGAG